MFLFFSEVRIYGSMFLITETYGAFAGTLLHRARANGINVYGYRYFLEFVHLRLCEAPLRYY